MDKLTENIKELIAFVAEKAAINEENRSIRFVISSDKIDRDNEKIEVAAVAGAIKAFAKNPVALASHQHVLGTGKAPAIGHWDTDSFKATAHTSEMDLIFADTELGNDYWELYKDKHMRAVSIGFRPLEWHEESDQKNGRFLVFTKIELYEISACAVGANREALSKSKIKDFFDENKKDIPQTVEEYFDKKFKATEEAITNQLDKKFKATEEAFTNQIEELKDLLSDSDGFAKSLLSSGNEPPVPADDKSTAERVLKAIKNVISERSKNG